MTSPTFFIIIIINYYYIKAYPANSQASTQTLSKRENNGLQRTSEGIL